MHAGTYASPEPERNAEVGFNFAIPVSYRLVRG